MTQVANDQRYIRQSAGFQVLYLPQQYRLAANLYHGLGHIAVDGCDACPFTTGHDDSFHVHAH
jgi:hypothetical protein